MRLLACAETRGPRHLLGLRACGYLATLVAGVKTRENDTDTGTRPGYQAMP